MEQFADTLDLLDPTPQAVAIVSARFGCGVDEGHQCRPHSVAIDQGCGWVAM
jgi:hypothetical protein